jgi:circadian clock protein KaiB
MAEARGAGARAGTVGFQVFMAGDEPHSMLALNNLKRFCEAYLQDRYEIQVVDVFKSFDTALTNSIFLTPAVIKMRPSPRVTIFGNLSDAKKLLAALQLEIET